MKNIIRGVTFFCIMMIICPSLTQAITLKEYEDQVAKYTAELQDKQNQIATSEEEISKIKETISSIKKQINEVGVQMNQLEAEITNSSIQISQKQEQIKKIMNYYQVSSSSNSYMEYVFGSG